jgi:hypothetical protein
VSKRIWELYCDDTGDRFRFATSESEQPGIVGSIVNVGNERPLRADFFLPVSDARAIGEMLIAAAKEAKSA